jgi:hypothetical protein
MNPDVIAAVKSQLSNAEDNLYRAKHAALTCDPSKQWGQSGQTLNEIIAGYDAEVARWKRALADVS